MEAKSITIFNGLPVDLVGSKSSGGPLKPIRFTTKKGEALTSPGVRLTHT